METRLTFRFLRLAAISFTAWLSAVQIEQAVWKKTRAVGSPPKSLSVTFFPSLSTRATWVTFSPTATGPGGFGAAFSSWAEARPGARARPAAAKAKSTATATRRNIPFFI